MLEGWQWRASGIGFGAIACATALGAGVVLSYASPSDEAFLIAALAITLALPLAWRVFTTQFDPFEPIVIFAVAYGVMFVARPAAMLLGDDLVYTRPTRIISVADTLAEVLVLALVGAVGFMLGYALPLGRKLARRVASPPTHVDPSAATLLAFVTAGVGAAAFLGFLLAADLSLASILGGRSVALTDAIRATSSYLWLGWWLLIPASLVLVIAGQKRRDRLITLSGVVLIAAFGLRELAIGQRISLLPLVGALVVYGYLQRNARPSPATAVVALVLALLGSALLLQTRDAETRAESSISRTLVETIVDPLQAVEPIVSGPDAEMAPALAASLTIIPEHLPYTYGRGMIADALSRAVPRALWADKPRSPREQLIPVMWPREPYANPEFSVLFHFYREWGVIGVAFGLMGTGIVARGIYEYLRAHRDNAVAQMLFGLSLMFVVLALRDGPVDNLLHAGLVIFPLWAIFTVAGRHGATPMERARVAAGASSPTIRST